MSVTKDPELIIPQPRILKYPTVLKKLIAQYYILEGWFNDGDNSAIPTNFPPIIYYRYGQAAAAFRTPTTQFFHAPQLLFFHPVVFPGLCELMIRMY